MKRDFSMYNELLAKYPDDEEFRVWAHERAIEAIREHMPDDRLAKRAKLKATIEDLAEDGKVAIVWGFRDCDMAVSDGNVDIIPAQLTNYLHRVQQLIDWHDEGPVWWDLEKPSIAAGVEHVSRDLALEAFEDGHPHVVYV